MDFPRISIRQILHLNIDGTILVLIFRLPIEEKNKFPIWLKNDINFLYRYTSKCSHRIDETNLTSEAVRVEKS